MPTEKCKEWLRKAESMTSSLEQSNPVQANSDPSGEGSRFYKNSQSAIIFWSHGVIAAKSKLELEDFEDGFSKLSTFEERLEYISKDTKTMDTIREVVPELISGPRDEKSTEKSAEARASGNKYFQQKKYSQALDAYSEAILRAPHSGSNELALGFANRSAAFFYLNRFKETLLDVEDAIKFGYPQDRTHILLCRKIKSLKSQRKESEAKNAFEEGRILIEKNIDNEEMRQQWLDKLRASLEDKCTKEELIVDPSTYGPVGPKNRNKHFPTGSASIKLDVCEDKGRMLKATKEIKIKETIIEEVCYASILADQLYPLYCNHCLKRFNDRFFPCSSCCLVRYCTEKCAIDARDQYHGKECHYLDCITYVGVGHLALRVLFKTGTEQVQEAYGQPPIPLEEWPKKLFDAKDVIPSLCYFQPKSFFQWYFFYFEALFLMVFAEHESLLKEGENNIKWGALLLRLLLQVKANGVCIYDLYLDKSGQIRNEEIGFGIFPSFAMINHSCDPNVVQHYVGDKMMVFAVKKIKPGEEVVISYGVAAQQTPVVERQAWLLNRYGFKCLCTPCQVELDQTFKCPKCGRRMVASDYGSKFCEKCQVRLIK